MQTTTITIVTPFDHAIIVDGQVMPDDYDPFAAFALALADRIEGECPESGAAMVADDPRSA